MGTKIIVEKVREILDSYEGQEELKDYIRDVLMCAQYNILRPDEQRPVYPGIYFFEGKAETGKSQGAELLARCLYEMDLIDSPEVIFEIAKDLRSDCEGNTSEMVQNLLKRSFRRVLFIDNVYGFGSENDRGCREQWVQELDQIMAFLAEEENCRNCCIIFSGYHEDMHELMDGVLRTRARCIRFGR